ncbi:uncharacterized protein [Blastocystis hominis]|uniref:Succinate-semialdehyde dehydrogenase, mitochondrial n=1 Tax=Blastocystis hominis TaxID=12968 RepID=D8M7B6_BLAHO|nr:uncharacterized protein [Blastocystis hominis]CBK23955.2 unnamed protein product [Blastocystis hominis]|eukprot:XP_012898003.1 uncharacterized protein [Blastocystis hominis]
MNSTNTFDVKDPATGKTVGTVMNCDRTHAEEAIRAAKAAFPEWASMNPTNRSAILFRLYDLLIEHSEELSKVMTLESGKPIRESRGEVQYGANFVRWFAEESKHLRGQTITSLSSPASRQLLTLYQPVGVVGLISSWNFPIAMITRKMAAALSVGCTCVLKPPSASPLSALYLALLAERAGVPPGVFNVVCCTSANGKQVGKALLESSDVRALSFTGSTSVGQYLIRESAGSVKKLGLELGGNAPFIVFKDCNLEDAVEGAIASKFRNSGQTCICANRLFVEDSVCDEFTKRFVKRVRELKVSHGLEEDCDVGPLINRSAVESCEEKIRDAVEKGARVLCGGKRHILGGNFYEPTVLTNVTRDMKVFSEESFAPIAPILRFSTEEEAIEMANDTNAGLASYVYSRDIGRCMRVARALEYGIVGVNEAVPSAAEAPFGGMKQSGLGREGGASGLMEYVEEKYVCLGGLDHWSVC